jgi:hypothetical protein
VAKINLKSPLVERFNAVPTGVRYPTAFESFSRNSRYGVEESTGLTSLYETEYALELVLRQTFTVPNSCRIGTIEFDSALRTARICTARKLYADLVVELNKVLEVINHGERGSATDLILGLIQAIDRSV